MSKPFAVTSKLVKDIDLTVFDELKKRLVGDGKVVHVGVPEGKKAISRWWKRLRKAE